MTNNLHEFSGSSSIRHCDYKDGKMTICFQSGGTYEYECDEEVYTSLKNAKSPGSHFHSVIRNKYNGRKI